MKQNTRKQLAVMATLVSFVIIASCSKFKKTEVKEEYLETEIPAYFPNNMPELNAQIHLGRVLFYDKHLSVNNSVACASCHKQQVAFADNVALSAGFENRLTKRNSIAIQNIGSGGGFFDLPPLFWDGRENLLTSLISKPVANHIEMGMDNEDQLLDKLNDLSYIRHLAEEAYGPDQQLTMERLSLSMTQFLSLINSQNSKFDQATITNSTPFVFNSLEIKGQQLFQTTYQCNSCHHPTPGGYFSSGFVNIGLEVSNGDIGRMNISNSSSDEGAFKVPDLHNVALTAPYMHDGRFKTLNEVMDHYSHGIQASSHLDPRLRNQDGSPKKLNITEEDRVALIAFLNTMTDYTVLTNPLLSNPFKYR